MPIMEVIDLIAPIKEIDGDVIERINVRNKLRR